MMNGEMIMTNDFYRVIETRVRAAVALEENRNEDGSVNWNFVDADVFMETNPTPECRDLYYTLFERACDVVEVEAA
jgi:hypothetical protein